MNLSKRTEEELSSFIHFGAIMNDELRASVAEILLSFLYDPDFEAKRALRETEIQKNIPTGMVY